MRRVASTVNVITICVDGEPMGITATAMSSHLDGPAEPAGLHQPRRRRCTDRWADVSHFRVNVLHRDQEAIARDVRRPRPAGLRFVAGWDLDCAHAAAPADAQASILCRRIDHHQFGTHSIFIGVVEEVLTRAEVDPLVYLDGSYGSASF